MARKEPKPKKARPKKERSVRQAFDLLVWLRNSFFTGIIVATPVTVTTWLVYTFVTFVDRTVKPLIPAVYNPETYLKWSIPGLGLVFAILFLTALGALAANILGRTAIGLGERIVERLPLVRNIYGALKQIVETIIAQRDRSFKEVVLVEFGATGLYCVGFITGEARGDIRRQLGEDFVAVFVPTAPNPTTGVLFYVRRAALRIVDMSSEAGAKLIISLGIVTDGVGPGARNARGAAGGAAPAFAIAKDAVEALEKQGAVTPLGETPAESPHRPASAGAEPGDGAVAVEEVKKRA